MAITTAMATSAKVGFLTASHCFAATVTVTANAASGTTLITNVSSMSGISVGMTVANAAVPVGSVVATIVSTTSFTISNPTTASFTAGSLVVSGDVFKIALIKTGMAGTYDASTVNYSAITGNTDETTNTAGTSYVAGGQNLTNVAPVSSGSPAVAYTNFSPNPSWTVATFSAAGAMIYNSSTRSGVPNACIAVYDFGGFQQVTNGTFTVLLPTASATTAVIRIA